MNIDAHELRDILDQLVHADDELAQISKEMLIKLLASFESQATAILNWDLVRPRWKDASNRAKLDDACRTLREASDKLASDDFDLAPEGERLNLIVQVIFAIDTVTKLSTSAVENYLQPRRQAAHARAKRRENPREIALVEAIEREVGAGHSAQPWKDAASILDGVNGRLKSLKFDPVKVDVIRRRLENR
jgi:hypothetical protein